jgi:hypothetical protein
MTRDRTLQWPEAGIFLGGLGALGYFNPIAFAVLTIQAPKSQ